MIRRKKQVTSDFKIKTFVSMLFLIIVFLVGYAYVMYHTKVLTRMYFDKVKLDKAGRHIKIFSEHGQEMITGQLGRNIHGRKPFACLDRPSNATSMCLEWDSIARLYIRYEHKETISDCYTIEWQPLSAGHYPQDCYDLSDSMGHWYGGGITKNNDWPFDRATFEFTPFITGDAHSHQFGNALRRYFISSNGVAIQIDDRVPLHLSMNQNGSNEFCMRAQNDAFAFVNRLTRYPVLKYSVCVGDDMKALHQELMPKTLWDGLKPVQRDMVQSILEEPVLQIPLTDESGAQLTETAIYNFTEEVIEMGFLRLGHVLINEFWQKEIGDFTLDSERFPTLDNTVNILHRRGFKVALTIQPFISTNSANFGDAVRRKILIYERLSERTISALTRYKSSAASGVLDVTNAAAIPWLVEKLQAVVQAVKIDSFMIDFGTAYNMPHYYQCNQSLINPDQYKTIFVANVRDAVPLFGVSGAVSVVRPPAFLALPPVNSSWAGLQSIVTTALSYGVLGYPFILPGPVGGDYLVPAATSATNASTSNLTYRSLPLPPLPSTELYIRWLQLATFLPAMHFARLPAAFGSEFVTDVAKELMAVRQRTVVPILKKYVSDAMNEGMPLVRPLWMIDTNDPACLLANDEFSIGGEVIVAPVLRQGQTRREGKRSNAIHSDIFDVQCQHFAVYLPHGVWKDGIDGSYRKGSRWIHNHLVPLHKVAYFVKMPDNTRF